MMDKYPITDNAAFENIVKYRQFQLTHFGIYLTRDEMIDEVLLGMSQDDGS
jgi:hypothetical protein